MYTLSDVPGEIAARQILEGIAKPTDADHLYFTFMNKTRAEEFLKTLRKMAYKYDIVVWNDILAVRGMQGRHPDGFEYGYDRETIKKLKVSQRNGDTVVELPKPKMLVRDGNGNWKTK